MEKKRIKLSVDALPSTSANEPAVRSASVSSSSSPAPPSERVTVSVAQLSVANEDDLLGSLLLLKKQLSTKAAVYSYFKNENRTQFCVVVELFVKKTRELPFSRSLPTMILKEAIGIIANCCYYSLAACLEMKRSHVTFAPLAVRIFESASCSSECKYSLMRLVANICAHKEAALCVTGSSFLLDLISQLLASDHEETSKQALRAVKSLVTLKFARAMMLSNAGFYLGNLLARNSEKILPDVVTVVERLCVRYLKETGRQLASSDCCQSMVTIFFCSDDHRFKELVIQLCNGSSDIRERLSESNIFGRLVEETEKECIFSCKLLAAFAQDAWGRASLRETGGLDALIHRLSTTTSEDEKLIIVHAFRHLFHDRAGMAHLARSQVFLDAIVMDILQFIKENTVDCTLELQSENEIYRPDSPLLREIESVMQSKPEENDETRVRLHKDFSSIWAYSSPSPAACSWGSSPPYTSPPYTSPSSGQISPVQFGTCSPASSSTPWELREHSPIREEDEESTVEPEDVGKAIVESELWLIAWLAQEDSNLPHLIREDVVESILGYLSSVSNADFRVGRVLRRMASSRLSIDKLLEMQFHTRVLNSLCAKPCRIVRFAKRCIRCEKSVEFGQGVVREFSSHVDSDFGHAFLVRRTESLDFEERTRGAIATMTLIRNNQRANRRLSAGTKTALKVLFESLESQLTREDFVDVASTSTYTNGPPLCAQIINAMSTSVSLSRMREIFDVDAPPFSQWNHFPCQIASDLMTDGDDHLRFETKEGMCLAVISLSVACNNSDYFQGMFSSDLSEKTLNCRRFVFDSEKEDCCSDDFRRFLHFLAGCRADCTSVDNAETCLAMIQLADRYLCSSLATWVCSPQGPVCRLLNGTTLPILLPAALTADMHPRLLSACLFTLIRFSTPPDVVATLSALAGSTLLVDSFISKFRAFIENDK